ncbi:hypothetical protein [Nocardia sp. NPDC057455]|uniref:hypothetical protein n=1 Tax=Nocardia sp. NPDC057455 TaxID=3346138 RepID=UPI00366D0419
MRLSDLGGDVSGDETLDLVIDAVEDARQLPALGGGHIDAHVARPRFGDIRGNGGGGTEFTGPRGTQTPKRR